MNKEIPARITYAQKRLIIMIQKRELRSWCLEHNLEHASLYRIALGEKVATYKIVSSLVHLIPPAEWIYYIDEKIPYELKTVPIWDSSKNCSFILKHKTDWQEVSKKYDVPLESCRNLFVNHRAKPSLLQIRKFALDTDPIEFFTEGDFVEDTYIPERGDVVSISGKNVLVLSKQEYNIENKAIMCICIEESCKNGMKFENSEISGEINLLSLTTITYSRIMPKFIVKLDDKLVQNVLDKVVSYFK
jgi:hypothetical protein